jgi:hypothetical protein
LHDFNLFGNNLSLGLKKAVHRYILVKNAEMEQKYRQLVEYIQQKSTNAMSFLVERTNFEHAKSQT